MKSDRIGVRQVDIRSLKESVREARIYRTVSGSLRLYPALTVRR
jgi:hypothetical protein